MGWFPLINDEVIEPLLNPKDDVFPFVWAIQADSGPDPWDTPEEAASKALHYKVDVDLIGTFWCLMGPRFMGMDCFAPDAIQNIREIADCL